MNEPVKRRTCQCAISASCVLLAKNPENPQRFVMESGRVRRLTFRRGCNRSSQAGLAAPRRFVQVSSQWPKSRVLRGVFHVGHRDSLPHLVGALILIGGIAGCGTSEPNKPTPSGGTAQAEEQKKGAEPSKAEQAVPGDTEEVAASPPPAEVDAAVRKHFAELSEQIKKKDYSAASKMMTPDCFRRYVSMRFLDAVFMADDGAMPMLPILKKYKLDKLLDEVDNIDQQDELDKLVLSRFDGKKSMLSVLAQLDKEEAAAAEKAESDGVPFDLFSGTVERSIARGEAVVLELKLASDRMEDEPGGEGLPADEEGLPKETEIEMSMPNFFVKFVKSDDAWK